MKIEAGFDYTSDLWYDPTVNDQTMGPVGLAVSTQISENRKKRVGPMIKVYMKLRTCTKKNQPSNCAATQSITKDSIPSAFHKNTDSGNTLSVSSVTGGVADATTGGLRLTVSNSWSRGGGHEFTATSKTHISTWKSSVKLGVYDKSTDPKILCF